MTKNHPVPNQKHTPKKKVPETDDEKREQLISLIGDLEFSLKNLSRDLKRFSSLIDLTIQAIRSVKEKDSG